MTRTNIASWAAALVIATGAAQAADLPQRAPAPAPVYAPASAYNWTGFYVGVNAGAAFGSSCRNVTPFYPGFAGTWGGTTCTSGNDSGSFVGGGQLGYNFQNGNFVFGAEADFEGLSSKSRSNSTFVTGPVGLIPGGTYVVNGGRDPSFLGTVRLRGGIAADRALFYVTGGLAYGSTSGSVTANYYPTGIAGPLGAGFAAQGNSGTRTGWTLGAGVEYAFTQNITARVEYLYANMGNNGNGSTLACAGGSCATFPAGFTWNGASRNLNVSQIRVGLNYKFGGPASPVVARY